MNPTARDLLEAAGRTQIPDSLDLFPQIRARAEAEAPRARWRHASRTRPAIALMLTLLALGVLSGAAYAIGRSLGYIPGLGLVQSDADLRVLSHPVTVEREGITLTVTQGLAGPDRTVLTFRVENIPEAALSPNAVEGGTPPPSCISQDGLLLPDGTTLSPIGGQGEGWKLGFEVRDVFAPLPAQVSEATLLVPCLLDTSPGKAPEDWRVPLVFVPAPLDLTIVPVIERTPTPPPSPESPVSAATPPPSPISIERTISLEDGTILIGSFHSITTSDGQVTSPYVWLLRITDAAGREVPFEQASDIDLAPADEQTAPFAYKISGTDLSWPLTLTIDFMEAVVREPNARFRLNTGPAPEPGQEWTINQDLTVAGYPLRVLTATRTADGYAFTFHSDSAISGVMIDIRGTTPYVSPAGGGGGGGADGSLGAGVSYSGAVPEGDLTVELTSVTLSEPGPWSIQWAPEGAGERQAPTATPATAACITDETWAQTRAAAPSPLPPNLPGRFFVFGASSDGEKVGVSIYDPADGNRVFLAEGSWPVASPDGTQVVFTGNAGLEIIDLSTGNARMIPGTAPTDYRMVWSPDGSRIAFLRSATNEIMVVDADGSEPRAIRDNAAVYHALVGWMDPDHLLTTEPRADGVVVQALDLTDGSTRDLFVMSSNKADTVVSPDGHWIAFTSSLGGALGNGLYVSRLGDSGRRLVAALDGLALYFPIWSPDDHWLILSLPDPGDPVDLSAQVLLNLESCQSFRLPDLGGDVYSWGK